MAASIRTHLSKLLFQQNRLLYAICVRGSRYDSKFIDNTRSLERLNVPLAEDDTRRYSKIKAARTDDYTFTDFDPLVQKLINMVMDSGKKALARELVYKALENVKRHQVEKYHKTTDPAVKETIELDPYAVFHEALDNGKPLMITKKVVRAGQRLQVPIACSETRREFLSLKWLIQASQNKSQTERFYNQLGREIINAYNHQGGLIKKKQEMHKLCEANKAYSYLA